MKGLTENQLSFIRKREQMLRLWPAVGIILFVVEASLAGWLFWKHPLLINPGAVRAGLESGAISNSILTLMAGMLPLTLIICLASLAVVIVYAFFAFAIEKRLISIIRTLTDLSDLKLADNQQ
jgi:hypothetical protein